ncbi:MAG: pyruvate, phosphate dikinase [Acidobacteria bacterium]|nr:pyruvate, phosphate dikinase [Acidobacteriota bacterium]
MSRTNETPVAVAGEPARRFVYDFDHDHGVEPMGLKALLGGKGANLAEMTSVLSLPVPHGFTIATTACRAYLRHGWPLSLDHEIDDALERLEAKMGRRFGDHVDPLLVSVRSGAQFSMPGMMDTVLNLGLNDGSVEALVARSGDARFAYDSYARFIAMYARIVLDLDAPLFDEHLRHAMAVAGVATEGELSAEVNRDLAARYRAVVEQQSGRPFPQEPRTQLREAIEAIFSSWNGARARAFREREGIDHDLGTAANIQAMVFGNRDATSGTGVAFTRNPSTGEPAPYGDFMVNAQGEDVVAGTSITRPLSDLDYLFPDVANQLREVFARLEAHFRDMCDIEFTVEQGHLWMLQTRPGMRTGAAALRMAVDMVNDPEIRLTRGEALSRITGDHLDQVLHPTFATAATLEPLAKGLAASPGAAVGRAYFDAPSAVAATRRGEPVVLVRAETSPDDVEGMMVAQGVITARGGLVSHAAVVARGWGKPAVVGVSELLVGAREARVGDVVIAEGDWLSLDGTAGVIVQGAVELASGAAPAQLDTILRWADEVRAGHLGVRANADTAADALAARQRGAEGIGLCRTEHMFLGPDRLPVVRAMILATSDDEYRDALARLLDVQRADFVAILEAMDALPVTVRLLDPPLHEFLPDLEALLVKEAREGLSDDDTRLLAAARYWHEQNPMLGVRGVRLGVLRPGLYAMQVRALLEAAHLRLADGGDPRVEIMIPLTISAPELALARSWVVEASDYVASHYRTPLHFSIGTMIETPRAALVAHEIAAHADFFSFGTNDLTQMTFGFSRDDVEGKLMAPYLAAGLLEHNPFDVLDDQAVAELVRLGIERGRRTNPRLKVGICGEHGGDPESIATLFGCGVDYVSCSPYRIPVARLAAAQAVLSARVAVSSSITTS